MNVKIWMTGCALVCAAQALAGGARLSPVTDDNDEDFAEQFAALHEELRKLYAEVATLTKKIAANFRDLMEGGRA